MADEVGVGLVGYGMAARVFHAPVVAAVPGLKLRKVVERGGELSRERYPWVEVVREADELLRDEEIKLVVVATPNDSHFGLARRALLAGKHVVVEKPFTVTSEEARQLIELARARGRLACAHQNRRWDGDFLTVRKLLEGGLLGRLVEFESRFDRFRDQPRPGAWREAEGPGGGILYDLGSHLIDQALVLFGVPRAVTADVRIQREFARADDYFDVRLDYDGLRVALGAGMLARLPTPRFVLRGTRGSFVKRGLDPQEEALRRGLAPGAPGWGEEPKERWGLLDAEVAGLRLEARVETLAGRYQDFYRNIADAVAGRAEPAVRPEESLDTIRLIELAFQSSREKRTINF
ncbi:MAG TPA: oxidoreductase [Pyrinomonadaceae bacterium]|nr:oxidoreductase [Pyrinomonadaceae bacterium]